MTFNDPRSSSIATASIATASIATAAIRGGMSPSEHLNSVVVPIYQTATFERSAGLDNRFVYSRVTNPTRSALEECITDLESGSDAVATPSGMSAILLAVMATSPVGSHVVIPDNIYGGTWDLFSEVAPNWGVSCTSVDMRDHAAVAAAIRPETTLVWTETPSNPMVKVTDIAAVGALAHAAGALLAVDSTFGTPALQQPLRLGADIVVHSTTKFLGGHSDVTGGAVVSGSAELGEQIRQLSARTGVTAAPFDSFLVLRGIRTLPVRMAQICRNAMAVARFLADHPKVSRVHYPGLTDHPDHQVAASQMSGFGGIVSVEIDGTPEHASLVCTRTKIFTRAVSLGGVESLIQHPFQETHCTTAGTSVAVPDTLLRISVGLEGIEDLITDLDQALHG